MTKAKLIKSRVAVVNSSLNSIKAPQTPASSVRAAAAAKAVKVDAGAMEQKLGLALLRIAFELRAKNTDVETAIANAAARTGVDSQELRSAVEANKRLISAANRKGS